MKVQQIQIHHYPNMDEIGEKKQLKQELELLRSDMLLSQPFVALLALRLGIVVVLDARLQTACTDGKNIFFNLNFIRKCNDSHRRFVLAHEVWHCVMGHFFRKQEREQLRWNLACDYEINGILSYFFKSDEFPSNILFEENYRGKSAEQIYHSLGKLPNYSWFETFSWGGGNLPVDNAQFDQHQPVLKMPEINEFKIDPDYCPQAPTELDVERWREYTAVAVQVTGINKGQYGSNIQHIVSNSLKPQIHWRTLLHRFVERSIRGSYQWQKPSRRFFAQGIYMPGRQANFLRLTLAIDTSGSTLQELPKFLAELTAILQEFERVLLQVISCDTRITDVTFYQSSDLSALTKWSAKGLGGTSFTPVFRYIENDPEYIGTPNALIFFTDGYGDAPQESPTYPVIWVLTSEGRPPVNWGEVISLS